MAIPKHLRSIWTPQHPRSSMGKNMQFVHGTHWQVIASSVSKQLRDPTSPSWTWHWCKQDRVNVLVNRYWPVGIVFPFVEWQWDLTTTQIFTKVSPIKHHDLTLQRSEPQLQHAATQLLPAMARKLCSPFWQLDVGQFQRRRHNNSLKVLLKVWKEVTTPGMGTCFEDHRIPWSKNFKSILLELKWGSIVNKGCSKIQPVYQRIQRRIFEHGKLARTRQRKATI